MALNYSDSMTPITVLDDTKCKYLLAMTVNNTAVLVRTKLFEGSNDIHNITSENKDCLAQAQALKVYAEDVRDKDLLGPQGAIGQKGYQGCQGFIAPDYLGPQGETGNTGMIGMKGLQGVQGEQGKGGTGARGSQGFMGPQGFTGESRLPGPQGTQGATGDTGSKYVLDESSIAQVLGLTSLFGNGFTCTEVVHASGGFHNSN